MNQNYSYMYIDFFVKSNLKLSTELQKKIDDFVPYIVALSISEN